MASTTTSVDNSPPGDERVKRAGMLRRTLRRPEAGALAGAIVIWLYFAFAAGSDFAGMNGTSLFLETASELGILTVAVTLLMIAGEFDLSVGSTMGAATMATGILATAFHLPLPIAMMFSLLIALGIGFFNGLLVVRTKLPSFIITLGSLFAVRGATIALSLAASGTSNVDALAQKIPDWTSIRPIFHSAFFSLERITERTSFTGEVTQVVSSTDFDVSILWWLALIVLATWLLLRTKFGNWVFAVGGDENAARNTGVPVNRVKIILFMGTAAAAWLLSQIQLFGIQSAAALRGDLQELYAISAAVIGGTLLTGGYGSVIGGALGALIYGMVRLGVPAAGIDSELFRVVLGALIIIAVLVNNFVRKQALGGK
ncbi:MAG: ABC transporter permease [Anaerolineaceae bacterium]|nr:ABC transporter permease [Anaerolineaceae bacterium]